MANFKPKLASKQHERKIRLAIAVHSHAPQARNAVGFSHRVLACAGLPHTDPGDDLPCWTRVNGHFVMTVQPGFVADGQGGLRTLGYPYGSLPRLVLIFLTTEAVRTRSPRIVLGRSMADFFRAIGLVPNSRRSGMLRSQLARLLGASIRVTHTTENTLRGADNHVANEFSLLWSREHQSAPCNQTSFITLNQRLFEELIEGPFPVDLEIVSGIRQSPMAIDLYLFLSYRIFRLHRPTRIPVADLALQMGANYANLAEFSRECGRALRLLKMFWPRLHYRRVRGALELLPSAPSVPSVFKENFPI